MAFDTSGNPIFNLPSPVPTGLTLPTPAPVGTSPLQGLIDSIAAPKLAKVPDSSDTLSLLLGALGSRSSAQTGQAAFANVKGSSKAAKAANLAMSQQGVPYKWGGNSWGKALDCSGLVQQAFKRVGISVPRTSETQWGAGQAVGRKQLQAGDAVFFHPGSDGKPSHVGLYIGNDQFVAAPHTGDVVHVTKLSTYSGYMGARRYR